MKRKRRKIKVDYKFIILIIVILLGVFVVALNYPQSPSKKLLTEIEMKTCKISSDCTVTALSCCGCNEGGQSICINKNFVNEWKQLKCPETVFCPQVYMCPGIPSCECVNSRCEITFESTESISEGIREIKELLE